MLGVSFGKVVVLVAVIAVVWFAFRWLRIREAEARSKVGKQTPPAAQPEEPANAAQDLRRCSTCGTFAASRCQRRDCAL
ncbi:MAG: hypothetical protein EAZ99_13890 [Alphaproteobacteria bacterium]|nr:hypothetical protein [Alphaproteobacteria bacterium]TAD88388.1 MAG: hypothetical protein EAZ99_13890 [Alphaproteobacteria bacterium]